MQLSVVRLSPLETQNARTLKTSCQNHKWILELWQLNNGSSQEILYLHVYSSSLNKSILVDHLHGQGNGSKRKIV